jgi:hypothetical protein
MAASVAGLTEVTSESTPAGSAVVPALEETAPLPATTFDAVGAVLDDPLATLVITSAASATSTRAIGTTTCNIRWFGRMRTGTRAEEARGVDLIDSFLVFRFRVNRLVELLRT